MESRSLPSTETHPFKLSRIDESALGILQTDFKYSLYNLKQLCRQKLIYFNESTTKRNFERALENLLIEKSLDAWETERAKLILKDIRKETEESRKLCAAHKRKRRMERQQSAEKPSFFIERAEHCNIGFNYGSAKEEPGTSGGQRTSAPRVVPASHARSYSTQTTAAADGSPCDDLDSAAGPPKRARKESVGLDEMRAPAAASGGADNTSGPHPSASGPRGVFAEQSPNHVGAALPLSALPKAKSKMAAISELERAVDEAHEQVIVARREEERLLVESQRARRELSEAEMRAAREAHRAASRALRQAHDVCDAAEEALRAATHRKRDSLPPSNLFAPVPPSPAGSDTLVGTHGPSVASPSAGCHSTGSATSLNAVARVGDAKQEQVTPTPLHNPSAQRYTPKPESPHPQAPSTIRTAASNPAPVLLETTKSPAAAPRDTQDDAPPLALPVQIANSEISAQPEALGVTPLTANLPNAPAIEQPCVQMGKPSAVAWEIISEPKPRAEAARNAYSDYDGQGAGSFCKGGIMSADEQRAEGGRRMSHVADERTVGEASNGGQRTHRSLVDWSPKPNDEEPEEGEICDDAADAGMEEGEFVRAEDVGKGDRTPQQGLTKAPARALPDLKTKAATSNKRVSCNVQASLPTRLSQKTMGSKDTRDTRRDRAPLPPRCPPSPAPSARRRGRIYEETTRRAAAQITSTSDTPASDAAASRTAMTSLNDPGEGSPSAPSPAEKVQQSPQTMIDMIKPEEEALMAVDGDTNKVKSDDEHKAYKITDTRVSIPGLGPNTSSGPGSDPVSAPHAGAPVIIDQIPPVGGQGKETGFGAAQEVATEDHSMGVEPQNGGNNETKKPDDENQAPGAGQPFAAGPPSTSAEGDHAHEQTSLDVASCSASQVMHESNDESPDTATLWRYNELFDATNPTQAPTPKAYVNSVATSGARDEAPGLKLTPGIAAQNTDVGADSDMGDADSVGFALRQAASAMEGPLDNPLLSRPRLTRSPPQAAQKPPILALQDDAQWGDKYEPVRKGGASSRKRRSSAGRLMEPINHIDVACMGLHARSTPAKHPRAHGTWAAHSPTADSPSAASPTPSSQVATGLGVDAEAGDK